MADTNGSNNSHEDRLRRLEAARKEMEDTLVVMAHLESKSAARIKEHAEILADHDAWQKTHQTAMAEFDSKLNALIDIVSRMQGGIESHS